MRLLVGILISNNTSDDVFHQPSRQILLKIAMYRGRTDCTPVCRERPPIRKQGRLLTSFTRRLCLGIGIFLVSTTSKSDFRSHGVLSFGLTSSSGPFVSPNHWIWLGCWEPSQRSCGVHAEVLQCAVVWETLRRFGWWVHRALQELKMRA
jgi:hypothetical protein